MVVKRTTTTQLMLEKEVMEIRAMQVPTIQVAATVALMQLPVTM
jgi:hypothetical protein